MNSEDLVKILIIVAGIIGFIVIILICAWIAISLKEKKAEKEIKKEQNGDGDGQVKKSAVIYTPESILDFMEFEKIEDNMIIQKKGKFLMVVECQGINYDLMSEMEKASVEQGFISFLNTLRYPIQLYIQTRTINLERSIEGYRTKLRDIERKYNSLKIEYENTLKNKKAIGDQIDKIKYEFIKQKNLKEYTEDIIKDVQRQSLNKSILSKKYYVIIPCYQSEIEAGEFNKAEVVNMAFSELYTRARAIINNLFACQVTGKILNSEELTELLYIAYNRDESDLFWMDKMRKAGFGELYSTAPDVIDKKMKLLDKQIEEKSIELANQKIGEARREKEIKLMEKEKNQEKIIKEKAQDLIQKHKKYIGEDITKNALKKLGKNTDENSEKMLTLEKDRNKKQIKKLEQKREKLKIQKLEQKSDKIKIKKSKDTDENKSQKDKEETENVNILQKAKRGRPRRKA